MASEVISSNGNFTIYQIKIGSPLFYFLEVASQPLGQSCSIGNGTGEAIPSSNVGSMVVDCIGTKFNVGVIVSTNNALQGQRYFTNNLVLQNNGNDNLSIFKNGGSTNFNTNLVNGSAYAVTALTQPAGLTCTILNGNGVINGADVIVDASCN